MKAEYAPLSSEAAPLIRVNPTLVLFTQGEISSTFGEGSHQGRPIYARVQIFVGDVLSLR